MPTQSEVRRQVREAVAKAAPRAARTLKHELADGSVAERFTSRGYTHVTTSTGHRSEPLAGHGKRRVTGWHTSHHAASHRGREMERGGWSGVLVEPIHVPPGEPPAPVDPEAPEGGSAAPPVDASDPIATPNVQEAAVSQSQSAVDAALEALDRRDPDHRFEAVLESEEQMDISEAAAAAVMDVLEAGGVSMTKASTPEPFSTSKTSNWVARKGGLPPYVQHIAHKLLETGRAKDESAAIRLAIGIVENPPDKWGAEAKAAAAKAHAEWEAKKGTSSPSSTAKKGGRKVAEAAISGLIPADVFAVAEAAAEEIAEDGFPLDWAISDIEEAAAGDYVIAEAAATSTEGRKELAGEGKAKSDGSFPIPNVAFLEKAIKAVGRASNPAAAKAWVIKRAKALKATGRLPDSWNVQEGLVGSVADSVLAVLEAKDGDSEDTGAKAKAFCVADRAKVVPTKDGKCPKCGARLPGLKG